MLLKEEDLLPSSQSIFPMNSYHPRTQQWRRFLRQRKLYKMASGLRSVARSCTSYANSRRCATGALTLRRSRVAVLQFTSSRPPTDFCSQRPQNEQSQRWCPKWGQMIQIESRMLNISEAPGPYRICYLESKVHTFVVFETLLLWLWNTNLLFQGKAAGGSVHLLPC